MPRYAPGMRNAADGTSRLPRAAEAWLVCLIALGVYGGTLVARYGRVSALWRPSPRHHYVLQAEAWLQGRLDIPPGLQRHDVTRVGDRVYVSFPPAPAVLLVPLVALWGRQAPVALLQIILAAASVGFVFAGLRAAVRRWGWNLHLETIHLLTVLYALGTMVWIVAPWDGVYFLAHVTALAGASAALWLAVAGRPGWAGLAWSAAFASRLPVVGYLPALAWLVATAAGERAGLRAVARLLAVPAVVAVLLGVHNAARFGNPLDFGYGAMLAGSDMPPDRHPFGLFDWRYLPRNLYLFFAAPPHVAQVCAPPDYEPILHYLRSPPQGMAIWFVTPAFAWLAWWLRRRCGVPGFGTAVWLSAGLTLLPACMYFNAGYRQWGCRFLLDVHPLLMLLLAPAAQGRIRLAFGALVGASVLFTLSGVFALYLRYLFPDLVI